MKTDSRAPEDKPRTRLLTYFLSDCQSLVAINLNSLSGVATGDATGMRQTLYTFIYAKKMCALPQGITNN